jgi:hypothetical protein
MLKLVLAGILAWIVLYSIVQLCIVIRFVRVFQRVPERPQKSSFPKAAIILAIRGPDPFLERNIRALLAQDYPEYTIFIVVDHVEDSAWPIVDRIRRERPSLVQVSSLKAPLATCSLKCSALVQAVTELDASYEVVAFVDGDTFAHQTWLGDLVEPLADTRFGASTGNRWYIPRDGGLGSMTRYFWNAGAVVQIWLNGFVWPGSMAIRRDVLKDTGIVSAWRNSLFDGPAVVRQIRRAGYKVCFVPSAMIVNRERISLEDFSAWVERQAVVARLLGSDWYILALHAINIVLCVLVPPLALLLEWSDRNIQSWAYLAAAAYWCVTLLSMLALERAVRRVLNLDEIETGWFSWSKALTALPSLILVHFVVLRAFVCSTWRRTISWRGIEYEIGGRDEVQMLNYSPFRRAMTEPDESVV